MTYYFCKSYNTDIDLIKYNLKQGILKIIYNEKYCETLIIAGKYIIKHLLEKVLDPLDIKLHKFC